MEKSTNKWFSNLFTKRHLNFEIDPNITTLDFVIQSQKSDNIYV